jgi:hypothetical protein
MTVKETPVNIRCLEYRQDKADEDYGSCLYARFYFNPDTYELTIISDAGNYAYQWPATPAHESFLELMARITDGYLLMKLCGSPMEFDYEATKSCFYDNAYDEIEKKWLDEIFEKIEEDDYIPESGEEFIELFEGENNGSCDDIWEYLEYEYTLNQKKIASVFKNHIQPAIRKMVKSESEDKE